MLDPITTPAADPAAIRRDLEHMTRHWHELPEPCLFEIRALAEDMQPQSVKYSPDWMDDAVEFCVGMNKLRRNIYVVRNPIRQIAKGSASDGDILAARYLWADCDDPIAAGNVYRFDGPKWTSAVTTGRTPHVRVHTYWELDRWCFDLAEWRAMQTTIAAHFASDAAVINPSRIMRVSGTLTWPDTRKRGKGYVSEIATLNTEYPEARAPVSISQMARVFGGMTPARVQLSAMATPSAAPGGFQIDTGSGHFAPSLDRDQMRIRALAGQEWHDAVVRLVGSYVAKGLSDADIHTLTQPLTLAGYTGDQTAREVQTAIDGARRKGWTPQEYAKPEALIPAVAPDVSFDAPPRTSDLEWFDDVQPSLSDEYLIKGVLASGAMSVVYGPSNSGKTFFALDLAFHLAIGAPWRGKRIGQASVLYLAAEGGRGVLNRIAALKHEYGGICDVPMAIKRAGLDLLHDQADLQHVVDLAAEVKARLGHRPQLIVIDTLSRIMAGGDENSAADMTALIRNIDAIRETTGAHIMLVHHTGKDTARGARGHSSLRAATDTEIEVGNDNGARAAMVTKQRDYAGNETFPFTLKNVSLGQDQDGDEVNSCVVETVTDEDYQAASASKKPIGGNQKILLETFDQMVAEGMGKPNSGGVGLPEPGRHMTVKMDDLRTLAMGKFAASNKRGAFIEAWKALSDQRGIFCAASEMVWRTDRRIGH